MGQIINNKSSNEAEIFYRAKHANEKQFWD
jgi:hypothetical protein